VAKKRKTSTIVKPSAPPPRPREGTSLVAAGFLVLAYLGAALAFDSQADASFDAPKRLLALLAIAAAALVAFGLSSGAWRNPFAARRAPDAPRWSDPRLPLALFAIGAAATAVSALASPRRELALDSLRAMTLLALLLPLGASSVFPRRSGLVTGAFLAATAVDAVVSILQALRIYQPFPLVTRGDREATGAFAGNVGYLALALALATVVAAGLAMTRRPAAVRAVSGALVLLFVAALVVNRNLTAFSAVAVGITVLAFGVWGRRAILPLAGALVAGALVLAMYPPMKTRAREIRQSVRAGDWDALLSFRTGAWLAAVSMARERPVLGFGPGTFGAEFVRHRLSSEIAAGRRFATPLATSSYGEAHDEYLQPFAEEGAVAGVALVAAAVLVFAGVARTAFRRGVDAAGGSEAVLLAGLLAAGATAALTWFPLQRPITAIPLLLALGRAWRTGTRDEATAGEAKPASPANRILRSLALAAVLALLLSPEPGRYRAERELRAASDALRFILLHPTEVSDAPAALARTAEVADGTAGRLPGDPRPRIVQGSALLVRGEAQRALETYGRAFALGERGETDLNAARALERLGREDEARAAFVRAVWVSPALLAAILPDVQPPVAAEVGRLETELKKGNLREPPPAPRFGP
jgi:O-antigen ligase